MHHPFAIASYPSILRNRFISSSIPPSLASIIRSWYAELPENQAYSAKGDKFVVIVSSRENQRYILSMAKVFLLMGQKRFLAFCSLPLKVLEANAPASELCKLVASRQSGPRSLQVAAIDAAAS